MKSNVIKLAPSARVTVARGRSIEVPTEEKVTIGLAENGQPITRLATRLYLAGETVELPIDEIDRLRELGYLADPENPSPPVGDVGRTATSTN